MKARGIFVVAVAIAALVVPEQSGYRDTQDLPAIAVKSDTATTNGVTEQQRRQQGFRSLHVDAPYPFKSVVGSNPERICDRLDEAGFTNLGWRGSEVVGVWECLAQMDEAKAAEKANDNSLFYLLRGRESRRINYARLKINVPDPATSAQTLAQAQNFMRTFGRAAGFDVPRDLLDAIAQRAPANVIQRDVNFKLKPEFDDPDRLNLSIEFGPTLDAFYHMPVASDLPSVAPDAAKPGAMPSGKGSRLRKAN